MLQSSHHHHQHASFCFGLDASSSEHAFRSRGEGAAKALRGYVFIATHLFHNRPMLWPQWTPAYLEAKGGSLSHSSPSLADNALLCRRYCSALHETPYCPKCCETKSPQPSTESSFLQVSRRPRTTLRSSSAIICVKKDLPL